MGGEFAYAALFIQAFCKIFFYWVIQEFVINKGPHIWHSPPVVNPQARREKISDQKDPAHSPLRLWFRVSKFWTKNNWFSAHLCGKTSLELTNTDGWLAGDSVDGGYEAHKIVNGRKCYKDAENRIIQWDGEKWVINGEGGQTVFYSTSDLQCPHLAEWIVEGSSAVADLKFNGKTKDQAQTGKSPSDQKC